MAYVVQKGDNLATIAKKTGNTVADLQKWNNMVGTSPTAGGNLVVSSSDPNAKKNAAALAARTNKPQTGTTTTKPPQSGKPTPKPPQTTQAIDYNKAPQYGYGTVSDNKNVAMTYTDKNAEIKRATDVIKNRIDNGMDISSQLAYYKSLTGQNFKYTPSGGGTTPPGSTPQQPEGLLTEDQVQNMLNQQAEQFQNQLNNQNTLWSGLMGNMQNGGAGNQQPQQPGNQYDPNQQYTQMFQDMQSMYNQLQQQMQYYQMLQQYYQMYGGFNGQNTGNNSFM